MHKVLSLKYLEFTLCFLGIHLCPACQRCTELPQYFFPRYVNELTCDNSFSGNTNQAGCFLTSSFQIGTCQQITMTTDILVHKNGKFAITFQNATMTKYKEVYETETYSLRTCCECMVFGGK